MRTLTALFLATTLASGTALANQDFDFDTADANGDGQLSETEVSSNTEISANFDTMDANGDGYLDEAEVNSNLGSETEVETISQPVDEPLFKDEGTSEEALEDDRTDVEYDPIDTDVNDAAQDETTATDDSAIVDDRTDNNSGIDE